MDVETEEIKAGLESGPNMAIYAATGLSILLSLFMLRRNPVIATFFGLWPPTILGLASILKSNKMLKEQTT
jgi:hypothetical protein